MSRYAVKKALILALMVDALVVFIMQVLKVNPWLLICLYWCILIVKNTLDCVGSI